MAITASSLPRGFDALTKERMRKELSFLRNMEKDSVNNPAELDGYDYFVMLGRTLGGVGGYPIGHVASSARMEASSKVTTVGGSVDWTTGLTAVKYVTTSPCYGATAPGTAFCCVTSSIAGGIIRVDAYKPTSNTDPTLTHVATDIDVDVIAHGT